MFTRFGSQDCVERVVFSGAETWNVKRGGRHYLDWASAIVAQLNELGWSLVMRLTSGHIGCHS